MREGTAKEVDKLADILDLLVINLKESGQVEELKSASLFMKVLKKLTVDMIARYKRWVDENHKLESVEVIREWINREAEYRVMAAETVNGLGNPRSHVQTYHQRDPKMKGVQEEKRACAACGANHPLWKCDEFKSMDVCSRWNVAKKGSVCFRCLSTGHHGSRCNRNKPCGIDGCKRPHSRLLHEGERPVATCPANEEKNEDSEEYSHTAVKEGTKIALRTIPVVIRNGSRTVKVNALLDDGSTRTYINSDVANEINLLKGKTDEISVGTMGGARRHLLLRRGHSC